MSFRHRGYRGDGIQEPNFQKCERAFETIMRRMRAKINSLKSQKDSETKYSLLHEAAADVKNANKYLEQINSHISEYQYHEKETLEKPARKRLEEMRSRLREQKDILHTYARLLDPDMDVVTPEERADRRMLNGMSAVQMDTRSRLDRSLHVIAKTKETGNETMNLLGQGTEALERARDNLEVTNSINQQARTLVNSMANRVWRDRAVQITIIILELLIIVMILLIKYF